LQPQPTPTFIRSMLECFRRRAYELHILGREEYLDTESSSGFGAGRRCSGTRSPRWVIHAPGTEHLGTGSRPHEDQSFHLPSQGLAALRDVVPAYVSSGSNAAAPTSQPAPVISAVPPQADSPSPVVLSSPVPETEADYSMISSASNCIEFGTLKLSALAVFRLMTSSNFVGSITGRSPGISPFRIRAV
jgi:hypothetical protein